MFLRVKMSNVFFGNFTCVISISPFPLQLLLGPPPPCLLPASSFFLLLLPLLLLVLDILLNNPLGPRGATQMCRVQGHPLGLGQPTRGNRPEETDPLSLGSQ